jgi:hypothetical protein
MPRIFVASRVIAGDIGNEFGVLIPIIDARHLFLIFQYGYGDELIIRGGPEYDNPFAFGRIRTQANVNPLDTRDSPLDASGLAIAISRAELDLQGQDPYAVWDTMIARADAINKSNIPYAMYLDAQNSNSVVASVMDAAGFSVAANLPPGSVLDDFPGISNLLNFSSFDLPNPFAGFDNPFDFDFSDGLELPSFDFPNLEASSPSLPSLELPDFDFGSVFGVGFFDD